MCTRQKKRNNNEQQPAAQKEKEQSAEVTPELNINLTKDSSPESVLSGRPLGSSPPTAATIGDVPPASIAAVDNISEAVAKRARTDPTNSLSSSSTAEDENSPAAQQPPAASGTASGGAIASGSATVSGGTFHTRQDDAAKNLHQNSNLCLFLEQIVDHVNSFSPALRSCWLEPLVSFNDTTNKFVLDISAATKHNIAVIKQLNDLQAEHQLFKYDRQKFIDFFEKKLLRYKTMSMTYNTDS